VDDQDTTMSADDEHLRLLSIFHYVVAGLGGVFALIPVLHVALGIGMVTGRLPSSQNDTFAPIAGWFFIAFGLVFILFGLSFAVLLVLAGRFLVRRRHYMYCLVMAALACGFMPFGTLLGVFTIVVLQGDTVKLQFGRVPSAPPRDLDMSHAVGECPTRRPTTSQPARRRLQPVVNVIRS
jgi:hypothetical protein